MVGVAGLFGDAEVFAGLDGRYVEMVRFGDAIDRLLDVRFAGPCAAAIDQSVSPGPTVTVV